jgi:hypothetical protein
MLALYVPYPQYNTISSFYSSVHLYCLTDEGSEMALKIGLWMRIW